MIPVDCTRLKSQHSADFGLSSHNHRQGVTSTLSDGIVEPFSAFLTQNTSNCDQVDQFGDYVGARHFSDQETDGYESFTEKGTGDRNKM